MKDKALHFFEMFVAIQTYLEQKSAYFGSIEFIFLK